MSLLYIPLFQILGTSYLLPKRFLKIKAFNCSKEVWWNVRFLTFLWICELSLTTMKNAQVSFLCVNGLTKKLIIITFSLKYICSSIQKHSTVYLLNNQPGGQKRMAHLYSNIRCIIPIGALLPKYTVHYCVLPCVVFR